MSADTSLLSVEKLDVCYGVVAAVRGVDFSLSHGTSTAIVGSNGAGKSTTLLSLVGCLPNTARQTGNILIDGKPRPRSVEASGLTIVPENGKVFTLLTVEENLRITGRRISRPTVTHEDVYTWFPRLAERRRTLAGNLSGGEQQMLAIGMALVGCPRLLILDEPTLGLAVPAIESMCEVLNQLRRDLSLTLLIAEADIRWLTRLADAAIVIDRGRIVARYASISDNLSLVQKHLTGGDAECAT